MSDRRSAWKQTCWVETLFAPPALEIAVRILLEGLSNVNEKTLEERKWSITQDTEWLTAGITELLLKQQTVFLSQKSLSHVGVTVAQSVFAYKTSSGHRSCSTSARSIVIKSLLVAGGGGTCSSFRWARWTLIVANPTHIAHVCRVTCNNQKEERQPQTRQVSD